MSAIVEPGQHLVHALGARRDAWIQIVSGQVQLEASVLSAGDAAALTTERAVSLTAICAGEVLLLDLARGIDAQLALGS